MAEEYVKRSDVHKAFQPKYAPAINRAFAAMINSVPAADVVEVVRCYECIHHDEDRPFHYCRRLGRDCPDDCEFYCAFGKRKDGGQDDGTA